MLTVYPSNQGGNLIEHTDKCKQAKTANAASRANWLAKWPKHCPRCEGTGGQGMEDDICTCLDEGYCPRCGYHAPTLQPFVWIGGMIADLGTTLFRRFALYPRISSPWKRKANRAMHQLGIRLQNRTFNIVGVCVDPINNGKVTYVHIEQLRSITDMADPNIVLVKLDPSADRSTTLAQINDEITSVNADLTVFELDEVLQETLGFLGSAWSTVLLLPLFTLTSAALCLIGYMMVAVDEQRQEFAILRATGAKPNAIIAILAVQSIVVLLSSFAVGISLGVITTLLILVPYPVVTGLTILEIAAWLFAALAGMFLLSLYPAARFAKTPILKIMP